MMGVASWDVARFGDRSTKSHRTQEQIFHSNKMDRGHDHALKKAQIQSLKIDQAKVEFLQLCLQLWAV
jgi:hypothetical protein